MKKLLTLALAGLLLCGLAGCTSPAKEPKVADIMSIIRDDKSVDLPEMVDITFDRLAGTYEIPEGDTLELSYVMAGSGATADEIFIARFASKEKAADFKPQMEARQKQASDLFADYNPDEMPKIKSCVIEVKNDYVFFSICNDNAKAKKIFTDSF